MKNIVLNWMYDQWNPLVLNETISRCDFDVYFLWWEKGLDFLEKFFRTQSYKSYTSLNRPIILLVNIVILSDNELNNKFYNDLFCCFCWILSCLGSESRVWKTHNDSEIYNSTF